MGEQNFTLEALQKKTLKEIYEYARKYKIKYYSQMNKKELSLAVIRAQAEKNDFRMQGILEIFYDDGGYGFLRPINYSSSKEDIYLSASQIKKFGLRNGDEVAGRVRPPRSNASNERYGMMYIDAVNGKAPDEAKGRPHFPALTAIYPDQSRDLSNYITVTIKDTRQAVRYKPVLISGQTRLSVVLPAKSLVKNLSALPKGTQVAYVTSPNFNQAGSCQVKIKITYPDKSSKTYGVIVTVIDPAPSQPSGESSSSASSQSAAASQSSAASSSSAAQSSN